MRRPRGRILDAAVDIRRSSPTFGRHVAVQSSAKTGAIAGSDRMRTPSHFGARRRGSLKTTALYSAANDRGVAWTIPTLALPALPCLAGPVLSDKDRRSPRLKDAPELFE